MTTVKNAIPGLIAAGCLALSAGTPARALDLYGFGSYWDRGDAEGTWGAGIGLGLPLFTDHLRLDGRIYLAEDSDLDRDDELTLVPVDLGLQLHLMPDGFFDPYAVGGVSFIYADAEHHDVDSSWGGYLGGGVEWELLGLFQLFGEVVYRFQELEGGRGDQIDVSGYTGNVGVRLSF
jgi:hypothetical protein